MNLEQKMILTDDSFQQEVLKAQQAVLVDFWAPWCGPCRMLSPLIEQLARTYAGRVKILKLNVDEHPETAVRLGVGSVPTLLIFKGGQIVDRIVGLPSSKALMAKLECQLT
ncbi:MAG: thioredoxin [Verrucomicrobiales bacterium]|nr:thioredoxin [Verrucomicrobiales bacterium]